MTTRAFDLDRLTCAFHEAAHAVIGTAVGIRVKAVTINDPQPVCTIPTMRSAREIRGAALLAAAGAIAARHLAGADHHSADTSAGDEFHINRGVSSGLYGSRAEIEQRAAALVGKCWDSIELLALELYQRGRLSGAEVRALVGKAVAHAG